MRIGMLEDDPAQTELLQSWIREANHESYAYDTGEAFRRALKSETFDILIVDWNLPDTSGPEVAGWIRSNLDWHIPIVFITSRDREEDVVTALECGADDYMTKPVRKLETLARLGALERRMRANSEQEAPEFPPYRFDLSNQQVFVDGEAVELRNKEFHLALLLFRNAGRLLSRSYILESVWGTRGDLNTRTVDTHTSRIRSKLGIGPDRGWKLSAIYHHGYRLEQLN